MTVPFVLLIAWRFIRSNSLDRTLITMTRLCFISIFIATSALTLITAIMRGVALKTTAALQQMTPDLFIRTKGKNLQYPKIKTVLNNEFSQQVQASSPVTFRHALIQAKQHKKDLSTVITLVIIDPDSAASMYAIPLVSSPHKHLPQQLLANEILIGAGLAQQLAITQADTVTVHYPDEEASTHHAVSLLSSDMSIAGIFCTGLDEWDDQVGFISFAHAQKLFGEDMVPVQQINLKLHSGANPASVQSLLAQRLHLPVLSWYDLNPAVVSALKIEELAMFLILSLIVLITSITTMSLLSMHIVHHQQSIALLYACGMSFNQLIISFIIMGLLLAGSATVCGIAAASIIGFFIDHYQLIQLPALYYSNYVPVHMSWSIALGVFFITLAVSIVATWYPARRIRIMPLRHLLS